MKQLTITEPGVFLSTSEELLVIKKDGEVLKELPLKRLHSIQIASFGCTISSNLLLKLAKRGISLFVLDFRQRPEVMLSGTHQHAVVKLRIQQIKALTENKELKFTLAAAIVLGKVRNQKSTLLYFSKGLNDKEKIAKINEASKFIEDIAIKLKEIKKNLPENIDSNLILGLEGRAAAIYWDTIKETGLLGKEFTGRVGRFARDLPNQVLNLGYSVLMSYVWHAVVVAGLEPYLGFYHEINPGKPSLVLDLMEEYRPWVVDRNVMKIRSELEKKENFSDDLKKRIISEIHKTFHKKILYQKKHITLAAALQRQIYRFCGELYGTKSYKPILFRW